MSVTQSSEPRPIGVEPARALLRKLIAFPQDVDRIAQNAALSAEDRLYALRVVARMLQAELAELGI